VETSVWILKWTNLFGIFCKISFTPAITSCYQVHALNADSHLSAALLCYLSATGAETSLLLTALNSPHPIHAADGHYTRTCITLLWLPQSRGARRNVLRGGGLKFWEKYFAVTKPQATLFAITFMSYMLFQF